MYKGPDERLDEIDLRLDRLTRQMELADKRMDRMEQLWEQQRRDWEQQRRDWEQQRRDWEQQRQEADAQRAREWREYRREMAEISDRIGRFTEDIVAPNIPRLAREWGLVSVIEAGAGLKRTAPGDRSRIREFDYVYVTEEGLLWSEAKATPRSKYLEEFAAALDQAGLFFPEMRGRPFYPVFGALDLDDSAIAFLSAQRIYALTLGDDTMVIRNPAVQPRAVA